LSPKSLPIADKIHTAPETGSRPNAAVISTALPGAVPKEPRSALAERKQPVAEHQTSKITLP